MTTKIPDPQNHPYEFFDVLQNLMPQAIAASEHDDFGGNFGKNAQVQLIIGSHNSQMHAWALMLQHGKDVVAYHAEQTEFGGMSLELLFEKKVGAEALNFVNNLPENMRNWRRYLPETAVSGRCAKGHTVSGAVINPAVTTIEMIDVAAEIDGVDLSACPSLFEIIAQRRVAQIKAAVMDTVYGVSGSDHRTHRDRLMSENFPLIPVPKMEGEDE